MALFATFNESYQMTNFSLHQTHPALDLPVDGLLHQALLAASERPSTGLYWLLLAAIAFSLVSRLLRRFRHLAKFRGPWIAAYTRLWLCRTIASGNMAQLLVDVNKKYGPVARIGPNHLVTDDPEFVKRMTAARSHYVRGPWFDSLRFDPGQSNISSERDTGKHNHLRHQVAGGYTGKELDNLERDVSIRIAEFIAWLERRVTGSDNGRRPVEIANAIQYLALDMITHLCYGYPLGFGDQNGELRNFTKALEMQLPIVQHFSVIVEAHRLLQMIVKWKPMRPYFSPSAQDKHGVGVLMRVCKPLRYRHLS